MDQNIIYKNEKEDDIRFEKIYGYQEYYLIKENNAFKIIIEKTSNNIIIKCRNYEIKFNNRDLSLLTKVEFKTIDDSYDFINNIFEENKVIIQEIKNYYFIKLILKIHINHEEKNIEITLLRNDKSEIFTLNEIIYNYKELLNDVNILKEKYKILEKEVENISNPIIEEIDDFSNITLDNYNIQYKKEITYDSFANTALDNTFSIFKSIEDILFLIYSNKDKSIITLNVNENKKINEIKKAHDKYITNFNHYLDLINKRDLVISISYYDNNIKLWKFNTWEILANIKNINNSGCLDSACFLNDNNQIYILTSNSIPNEKEKAEPIKIFDLKGNKIKEINNSNNKTFFIDMYYENKNKLSKIFIITGNYGYSMSFDYKQNKIYHKYYDDDKKGHFSAVVYSKEEIVKLIESSFDGNIRIWNFHSGLLLNKINVNGGQLYGICLLDNKYLLVGCEDKSIKVIELENKSIIKSLNNHNREVITIKIMNYLNNTSYILSQGKGNDQIKCWKIEYIEKS